MKHEYREDRDERFDRIERANICGRFKSLDEVLVLKLLW
jgi:hypothetical protein